MTVPRFPSDPALAAAVRAEVLSHALAIVFEAEPGDLPDSLVMLVLGTSASCEIADTITVDLDATKPDAVASLAWDAVELRREHFGETPVALIERLTDLDGGGPTLVPLAVIHVLGARSRSALSTITTEDDVVMTTGVSFLAVWPDSSAAILVAHDHRETRCVQIDAVQANADITGFSLTARASGLGEKQQREMLSVLLLALSGGPGYYLA